MWPKRRQLGGGRGLAQRLLALAVLLSWSLVPLLHEAAVEHVSLDGGPRLHVDGCRHAHANETPKAFVPTERSKHEPSSVSATPCGHAHQVDVCCVAALLRSTLSRTEALRVPVLLLQGVRRVETALSDALRSPPSLRDAPKTSPPVFVAV